MTGVDSYSTTPATNATADGGALNWAEGQPPSSVNNTARQETADIRALVNDIMWFQYGTGDQGAGNLAVPSVYSSGTAFTITGADVTLIYHAGRRVRAVGGATGTIFGTISSSSYNGGNTKTTVNVSWDSGSLSNETLVICLSQAPITGYPIPGSKPPTRQVLTSGSAATYTTASGARQLRIRMVGGGGGGGAGVNGANNGGAGGTTIFNSINANGGSGGGGLQTNQSNVGGAGGTGGTGSASFRAPGGAGGTSYGTAAGAASPAGGSSQLGGGAIGKLSGDGVAAAVNTGAGGSGGAGGSASPGGSGGAGEYAELIINSPSATYTYTIGAAGAGSSGGTTNGGAGGSGIIIVDEYY